MLNINNKFNRTVLLAVLSVLASLGFAVSYDTVDEFLLLKINRAVGSDVNIHAGTPLTGFAAQRALWQESLKLKRLDGQSKNDKSSMQEPRASFVTRNSINLDARVEVLTPMSMFDLVVSVEIDHRVAALTPLSNYSLWDQLTLDPEVKQLTALADIDLRDSLFIDRRVTALTPLLNIGFESIDEALAYINASAHQDDDWGLAKTFVRDMQATLVSEVYYDDNIFSSPSNEKGSWVMLNNLTASTTLQRRRNTYLVSYSLRDGRFFDSPKDNFRDNRLYGHARQDVGRNQSVDLSGFIYKTHERRGAGVTEGEIAGLLDKPIGYERRQAEVEYQMGKENSTLRLKAGLAYSDIHYDSVPEITAAREYDKVSFDLEGFYRVGARTDLNVQLSESKTDYEFDPPSAEGQLDSLDSTGRLLLAGFERDIGRHSSGRFRWGGYQQKFVDRDRSAGANDYWDLVFIWRPRSYSTFNFGFKRQFSESRGLGDYISSRESVFSWSHSWAQRFRSKLNLRHVSDNYINFNRSDDRLDTDLRLFYTFNNRFSISGGARYHQRDSSQAAFDFERKVIFLESNYRM